MASVISDLYLERERQLATFFPEPVRFDLLYKGSQHGFKWGSFLSKMENEKRLVVIVYLKDGSIKGAYMSNPPQEYYRSDTKTFIFEIDQNETRSFPLLNPTKGVFFKASYSERFLTYGGCLRFYEVERTLVVDVMPDELNNDDERSVNANTGWESEEKVPYQDLEIHRVQSIGDTLQSPWRELTWSQETRVALRERVVSYKPSCQPLKRVRVLLLGPTGAGKSSFISSVRSVLFGRVVLLPFVGSATNDVIKKLRSTNIRSERGGKTTALTMVDVHALGDVDCPGLTFSDALAVIKGHAPEGYKFETDKPLKPLSMGYRAEPSIEDKIHCVVFALNACHVMSSSDSLQETLRRLQVETSEMDIPQVVLLTNVDQVCHGVQEDVKYVYTSRIVQEKIHKAAEVVGLPVSYVFPVKNYSSELSVNCNTDILLLTAVSHILQCVDDTLEESGSE